MVGFVYVDKPPQLGYIDATGSVQMLDVWITDANQLTYIERCIRSRRWGNIKAESFIFATWTNYNVGAPDASTVSYLNVFISSGQPVQTPSYSKLSNMFLT